MNLFGPKKACSARGPVLHHSARNHKALPLRQKFDYTKMVSLWLALCVVNLVITDVTMEFLINRKNNLSLLIYLMLTKCKYLL